jgi:hypothetical protein
MSLERKPVKFTNNENYNIDRNKTYIKSPFNYPGSPNTLPNRPLTNSGRSLLQSRDRQQIYIVNQKQPQYMLKAPPPPDPQYIEFPAPGPTNIIVKGPPPPPTQILKIPRNQQPNIIVKGPPPLPPQILKMPPQKPQSLIIKG